MSQIVKCKVCGRTFNEKYVGSHERRAHGKKAAPIAQPAGHQDPLDEIQSLYLQLSEEDQRNLLHRLAALGVHR